MLLNLLVAVLPLIVLLTAPTQQARLIDPQSDVARKVADIGRPAAEKLMSILKQELTSAMRQGGPTHAVDFCSEQALPLTSRVGTSLDGLGLKRTTLKPRNPSNAPDSYELEVLDLFAARPLPSETAYVVQKLEERGGTVYRYYQPLYTAGLCLVCHGETISSALQDVLSKRYPEDQATGYRQGDFRGVIRVEISAVRVHD